VKAAKEWNKSPSEILRIKDPLLAFEIDVAIAEKCFRIREEAREQAEIDARTQKELGFKAN
jgi:hypothetical protein